ncbi:IS4 family transposase (plasmid) [Ralstonia pseudosolanacearum]|uniref:IS4 family transposase n=1 Tax=Ralstonia pseudosolanacearum TaxID=1310165 RepID=UPI0018D1E3B4|nr:IS4 family transposase [Ralstonia pseudosolanacearum]
MEAPYWTETEFADLDLGDAHLNKRARTLMERMSAKPTAGVPQACRGWGETIAAYRFFDNDEVEWSAILQPHWRQTEQRMAAQLVVLCLQDTTELDFNGRQATGLGPLSYEAQRGMYLHATYAVTPERVPLGVLDAWMWAREPKNAQGLRGGIKESQRWIEGYERVAETASSLPHTRLVYVADREADMITLMARAQALGTPADWLIRSTHDRALPEGAKLWACASEGTPLGEIAFTMGSRHGVKARPVRQHVWLRRIELPTGGSQSVAATCLVAREIAAPAGVKPIEWRLLTNREATTLHEAIELIDWYRARWEIEILFNVLKNGCRVEALQLGAIERLERALALFLVVAWRIAYLMRMGRTGPDLDAELFFDADEIRGAYLLTDVKQPAKPKLNEVLRLIARLGGFLGRKGDGEPGAKAIWLGLKEVHVAAKTLHALRAGGNDGSCV